MYIEEVMLQKTYMAYFTLVNSTHGKGYAVRGERELYHFVFDFNSHCSIY